MVDLTEWQINFVRKAIHEAIMSKKDNVHTEIDEFKDEFDRVYPGVEE